MHRLALLTFGCLLAWAGSGAAAPPVDPATLQRRLLIVPWDPWSLQDHRLANRFLPEQLAAPEQSHRFFARDDWLVLAADVVTGTSLDRDAGVNEWHGHALADVFVAARVWDGVDINANIAAYNVSASGGFRRRTGILPGIVGHVYGDLGSVRADFLATDLGAVTLGNGLMFEQIDMEGALLHLTWGRWWYRALIGGQVHVHGDDLFTMSVGAETFSLNWMVWRTRGLNPYLTLAGEVPGLGRHFRLAAEGALRLPNDNGPLSGAGMARADWMPPLPAGWRLHLGYQARYYRQGVGPGGDRLTAYTTGPAMVWREDTWFTNAFDAWWPSAYYHQWWHSVMFEGVAPIGHGFGLRVEVEAALKTFDDPRSPARRLPRVGFQLDPEQYPAPERRVLYRAGLELEPFGDRPHRLRLWLINKGTALYQFPSVPTHIRFQDRAPLLAFEVELYL